MKNIRKQHKAQMAVEYMLVLMLVVTLVLIGFKKYLPQTRAASNLFFNRAAVGIMGPPNPCGDGTCNFPFEDFDKCCTDCGGC